MQGVVARHTHADQIRGIIRQVRPVLQVEDVMHGGGLTNASIALAALAAVAVAPQNHVAFVDPFRIVIELIACHIAPGPVPSVCLPTAAPQPARYKERRPSGHRSQRTDYTT